MTDRRRRRSLSIFRPSLTPLTPLHDATGAASGTATPVPKDQPKKKRSSAHFLSASPLSAASETSLENTPPALDLETAKTPSPASNRVRPRSFQKLSRTGSLFGSFRSSRSLYEDGEQAARLGHPAVDGPDGEDADRDRDRDRDVAAMPVLHHGEVQSSGALFRKRVSYLVLTDTHLLRFKSRAKAAEACPSIPPSSLGRASGAHNRISSASSTPETATASEPSSMVALRDVVAVYKLDDGRPYFTIEVASFVEQSNQAAMLNLQLNDPREADLWLSSLRAAVTKAHLDRPRRLGPAAIEYVVRVLEADGDYDPLRFRLFTVVQRAPKSGTSTTGTLSTRASSDDLAKLASNICYLAIGEHRMHLVPLPRPARFASSASLPDMGGSRHALMLLTAVNVPLGEDTFQLSFRMPLKTAITLQLAMVGVQDAILALRQAVDHLRPAWIEPPFAWNVPRSLDDATLPIAPVDAEDHWALDRTLIAYCLAYGVDASAIRYTVDYECDDAPAFILLEPGKPGHDNRYTSMELLAILRALRYNETFHSIVLRDGALDGLHDLQDRCGMEHYMWRTRSGAPLSIPLNEGTPLMVQELQCLALKATRLRRMDFTRALTRTAAIANGSHEPSSGLCEAMMPLCGKQETNVDWIIFDGCVLSEMDIDYVRHTFAGGRMRFRALSFNGCSLDDWAVNSIRENIGTQGDCLEYLGLADNPGQASPTVLSHCLAELQQLRHLDLSRFAFHPSDDAVLSVAALFNWRLTHLNLKEVPLRFESVDALCVYLAAPQSASLREVFLEGCQLGSEEAAMILESMSVDWSTPRPLHLSLTSNRLGPRHSILAATIARSLTPTHLTLRHLEYSKEATFQELLDALAINDSLEYLDISRVSLPVDAGQMTCSKIQEVLANNTSLRELNLSGEHAHLEAVNFGPGLADALLGLKQNTALEVLHVEHQALGLRGASALATILHSNRTLRQLHCSNNDLTLQAFTIMVNAIKKNPNLIYMSSMDDDRLIAQNRFDRDAYELLGSGAPQPPSVAHHHPTFAPGVSSAMHGSTSGLRQPSPAVAAARATVRRKFSGAVVAGGLGFTSRGSNLQKEHRTLHRASATERSASSSRNDKRSSRQVSGSSARSAQHYISSMRSSHQHASGVTQQDVQAAKARLEESWDSVMERLQTYLARNYRRAQRGPDEETASDNGEDDSDVDNENTSKGRPTNAILREKTAQDGSTSAAEQVSSLDDGELADESAAAAETLATALRLASLDRTPTAELNRQLGVGLESRRPFRDGPTVESLASDPEADGLVDSPEADGPADNSATSSHGQPGNDDGDSSRFLLGAASGEESSPSPPDEDQEKQLGAADEATAKEVTAESTDDMATESASETSTVVGAARPGHSQKQSSKTKSASSGKKPVPPRKSSRTPGSKQHVKATIRTG